MEEHPTEEARIQHLSSFERALEDWSEKSGGQDPTSWDRGQWWTDGCNGSK